MSKRNVIEIARPTQSSYSDFALGMSLKLRGLAAVARGACCMVELDCEASDESAALHLLLGNLTNEISAVADALSNSEFDFHAGKSAAT